MFHRDIVRKKDDTTLSCTKPQGRGSSQKDPKKKKKQKPGREQSKLNLQINSKFHFILRFPITKPQLLPCHKTDLHSLDGL